MSWNESTSSLTVNQSKWKNCNLLTPHSSLSYFPSVHSAVANQGYLWDAQNKYTLLSHTLPGDSQQEKENPNLSRVVQNTFLPVMKYTCVQSLATHPQTAGAIFCLHKEFSAPYLESQQLDPKCIKPVDCVAVGDLNAKHHMLGTRMSAIVPNKYSVVGCRPHVKCLSGELTSQK